MCFYHKFDWLLDLCSFYCLKFTLNNTDTSRDVLKNAYSIIVSTYVDSFLVST